MIEADIAEKAKALMDRADTANTIAADIKRMIDAQGNDPPVWFTGDNIKGIDMRLPFTPADADVAIAALARELAEKGVKPVAVQHGLRVDTWSLNVRYE
jgi:hypothetical protein